MTCFAPGEFISRRACSRIGLAFSERPTRISGGVFVLHMNTPRFRLIGSVGVLAKCERRLRHVWRGKITIGCCWLRIGRTNISPQLLWAPHRVHIFYEWVGRGGGGRDRFVWDVSIHRALIYRLVLSVWEGRGWTPGSRCAW